MRKFVGLSALFVLATMMISCGKDEASDKIIPDVYVAGYEYSGVAPGVAPGAKYWKNGVATSLTDGVNISGAYSIDISDTNVYVAGYRLNGSSQFVATYWKNGEAVNLTDGERNAVAYSIAVSGNDVYVAGVEWSYPVLGSSIMTRAIYWKNGARVNLTDGTKHARANSICISGNDVYIAGYETNNDWVHVAKY